MAPKYIYLVSYTTGQYSDYQETPVAAFESKEAADNEAVSLNNQLSALHCHRDSKKLADYNERERIGEQLGLCIDYSGGDYQVSGPIELK